MLSTAIGALIGGAIDGADGDDSTADGALIGGAVGYLASALVPVVVTYAVGWAVLKGLDTAKDAAFGKGNKT